MILWRDITMGKERESSFELLRIICYFGIVLMHVYGNFMPEAKGGPRIVGILINCMFNTGVSIFILISGYFGIRSSYKKVLSFWLYLLFYSLLGEIIGQIIGGSFNLRSMITAFFPIYTRKWWFMSSYFLLMIFSPWINRIVNALSEKEFLKLCFGLFVIFSFIPSSIGWTYFGDSGKGIGNLFLMYLVGQYFSKYLNIYKVKKKHCIYLGLTTFGIMAFLSIIKTVLKRETGIEAPFFRDASSLTFLLSLSIFVFFRKIKISSKIINFIAKRGMGIFLIDGIVYNLILSYIDIPQTYAGIVYCIGTAVLIMIVGVVIESVRYPISWVVEKVIIKIVDILKEKILVLIRIFDWKNRINLYNVHIKP